MKIESIRLKKAVLTRRGYGIQFYRVNDVMKVGFDINNTDAFELIRNREAVMLGSHGKPLPLPKKVPLTKYSQIVTAIGAIFLVLALIFAARNARK